MEIVKSLKPMRRHFFYFAFIFLVIIQTSSLFSLERIDLIKTCDNANHCTLKLWEVSDSFREEFIHATNSPGNFKPIEKFPIIIQNIFPETTSIDFTLRTEFNLPLEYFNEKTTSGIYFDAIGDVYSIYINGKLIGKEGKVENGKVLVSRYGNHLAYPLNFSHFKQGKNILVIHLQGNPKFNLTGLFRGKGYYLDEYNTILLESRDRTGLILVFLYLFFGAYHLFLYFKRKHETYNFAFSILSIAAFIYLTGRSGLFFEYGLDSTIGYRIELMAVYFIAPSLGIFLELLFFDKIGRFLKYYSIFCSILFVVTPFIPQEKIILILRVWQISVFILMIFLINILATAIKKKSDSAKRLLFGFCVLLSCTLFDVLDSIYFKTGLVVTRLGFFSFIVGIVGILANRFLNLHEMVENLNKTLEQKVEKRTQELQETLKEVKLLKEQQDGDYFLTTLIINPLASNNADDEKLDLKILIHQKKKFEFRNKLHEIGGDICISETIYLKGKKYTAFVNGDAMGKSIQGAGGALVLGVVFKSILSRAKLFSTKETVSPERWLKLAFQELQSIFESFDGSMMISVVMGLIDNERGFIYYINAEHPFTVLYRDNKASFIEKELNLRKIGMMTLEHSGDFQVNTFKLEYGDVIILGSDGRDDIRIGVDAKGHRIINEDHTLFLKTVEQAEADLEKIFTLTEQKGELIDDYSLLRIEYKFSEPEETSDSDQKQIQPILNLFDSGNFAQAEKQIEDLIKSGNSNKTILKIRIQIAKNRKMYNAAAAYASEYLDLFPEENSFFLEAANYYYLIGNLESAADYSERLKLREPKYIENLILLTKIYFDLKIFNRAIKTLNNAMLLETKNPRLIDLKRKLESI